MQKFNTKTVLLELYYYISRYESKTLRSFNSEVGNLYDTPKKQNIILPQSFFNDVINKLDWKDWEEFETEDYYSKILWVAIRLLKEDDVKIKSINLSPTFEVDKIQYFTSPFKKNNKNYLDLNSKKQILQKINDTKKDKSDIYR